MGRSLLPWIALAAAVLAFVLYALRTSASEVVGLEPDSQRASAPRERVELAAGAEDGATTPALAPASRRGAEVPPSPSRADLAHLARDPEDATFHSGAIEVRVHDQDGLPLAGVRVRVSSPIPELTGPSPEPAVTICDAGGAVSTRR